MGQQSSKTQNDCYFRKRPAKNEQPNRFGVIKTLYNLKSVLGGVKSECNNLKQCGSDDLKHRFNGDSVQSANYYAKLHHKRAKECKNEFGSNKKPSRTNSEPNLRSQRERARIRCKKKSQRRKRQFGYEIRNIDDFLTKATLDKPANIPVVLAFPSVLYQTRVAGYQDEISLPLGMVVNAIFKNQNWLYVQTPHAEEGYISYSACLPLGIIPPPEDDNLSPCWEKSTDIFPKPSGNMTDTEKLSYKSDEDDLYCSRAKFRTALSTCGEKSVDRLYLRAAAIAKGKGTRHTLLVINEDYDVNREDLLSVSKNEVVFLLNASVKGWFYVKNKEGRQGYIPSAIAGHGFL